MKNKIAPIVLAAVALVLFAADPSGAFGQGPVPPAADLKARVSALIERFPADNAGVRDALCAELIKLGPAGLAESFVLVLPPGAGNDAKARFAINGLAVYVTRTGAEAERQMFVKAILATLASSADKQVASFFVSQVQIAGKAEAVKPLALYLRDQALAGPAVAALQTIGGPEAAKVLLQGLEASSGAAKLAIIDALGAMRSREAVKRLMPLAESNDPPVRRAARFALANIGDPSAGPALAKVRVAASWNERAEAPGLYLLYARRLQESGQAAAALEAARAVLAAYGRPEDSQVGAEALTLIVSILGEKAFPDLVSAVDGPSPALRAAALELATHGTGEEAGLWVKEAEKAGPEIRASIVAMLGRHRNPANAVDYLRQGLRDPDKRVRLAAIRIVWRLRCRH